MFVPIVRNVWLKRMYHAIWGKRLLWGAAAVIATSAQEAEELSGGGVRREKIALRRNGVEPPTTWPEAGGFRRKHRIPANAKLLLFLGRLSWKKSPELLMKAVASLPAQLRAKEFRVVFAGPDEGGVEKQLMQMASQLKIEDRVYFAGPVYGEAKWAAYRDADVFVLPSQNENFGNSAAEAVAAGTPVIVTEHCGVAPLLRNVAGLVIAHDAEALSTALARVLSEPGLYERLAEGCSSVAAQLRWDEPVREMEAIFERVLQARAVSEREAGN
jgi:glycosyltransferase involved in cell wall biosynthesis